MAGGGRDTGHPCGHHRIDHSICQDRDVTCQSKVGSLIILDLRPFRNKVQTTPARCLHFAIWKTMAVHICHEILIRRPCIDGLEKRGSMFFKRNSSSRKKAPGISKKILDTSFVSFVHCIV